MSTESGAGNPFAFSSMQHTPSNPKRTPTRGSSYALLRAPAAVEEETRLRDALRSVEIVLGKLKSDSWSTRKEALERVMQYLSDPLIREHP